MARDRASLEDVGKEAAAGLFPVTARGGPVADPAALASDIAAYLSEGGGAEARSEAACRLAEMARTSTADALIIVGAEGLLACVERRVTAGGTAGGDRTAADAVALLTSAAGGGDARVHARIAGEEPLLRALLLAVTRGPSDGARGLAATALHQLSHSASWEAAAREVHALTDDDLRAVTIASVCGRWGLSFMIDSVSFLARSARSEAVLRRLLGPAAFLRALAGLMGDEAAPDKPRILAAMAIHGLVAAANSRGVGDKAVFKPLVKPLTAASERADLPRVSPATAAVGLQAEGTLCILRECDKLAPAFASDIPRLVAALRGGGPPALSAVNTLMIGLGEQPGSRAAAVRAGVIPALVALLKAGDARRLGVIAALSSFASAADARVALRATDASARLTAMLREEMMWGLKPVFDARSGEETRESRDFLVVPISALSTLLMFEMLPATALIASGASARVSQIARFVEEAGDLAAEALLQTSLMRRSNFDAMVACGALRAALDDFVDARASEDLLLFTTQMLLKALESADGEWIEADVRLATISSVDRDCRQALASFLLLSANWDVLRRLVDIYVADQASATRGDPCAALYANLIYADLRDPGIVGPELARQFESYLRRSGIGFT